MENVALRNGLIGSGIIVALALICGFASPHFYVRWGTYLVYPIMIYFMVKTAQDHRRQNGGIASLGELFVPIFVCMSLMVAAYSIFNYIQFTVIQPELLEITQQVAIEAIDKTSDAMSRFLGADGQEAMEEAMEEAKAELEEEGVALTFGTVVINFFFSVFIGSIIGLIIAAIYQKSS